MGSLKVVPFRPASRCKASNAGYVESLTPAMKRGGLLAVDLLEELAERSNESLCSITSEWREKGTPQKNLVADYFRRLNGSEEIAGFGRILTEALSMQAHGNTACLDYLQCAAIHPA